jgi:hypothetical protein
MKQVASTDDVVPLSAEEWRAAMLSTVNEDEVYAP